MLFNSFEFVLFFIVISTGYFVLQRRYQNLLLLCGSYFFYGWWDWRFLSLLAISTVVDFYCGREMGRSTDERYRQRLVTLSILTNLGILSFFKYCNFFLDSLSALFTSLGFEPIGITLQIVLPVGISFYTFQTMSYTIDIYRKQLEPCKSMLDFALYVSFFPQLVAGPIERATRLIPQLVHDREITLSGIERGLILMLVGFFKKMVIADNLAPFVNEIFAQDNPAGLDVLIGCYAFAIQIYCDFSGYTDIARGIARVYGISLCENFCLPYFALNPSDFWRRWHISLSTWLRDYLYIPLGGNRKGNGRTLFNLVATMFLGGLWHGASWHFVVWGLYHGGLLCLFSFIPGGKDVPTEWRKDWRFFVRAFLFFQFTVYGWLIFRVESLSQLVDFSLALFNPFDTSSSSLSYAKKLILIGGLFTVAQLYQQLRGKLELWNEHSFLSRWLFCLATLIGILFFGGGNDVTFIYFQF